MYATPCDRIGRHVVKRWHCFRTCCQTRQHSRTGRKVFAIAVILALTLGIGAPATAKAEAFQWGSQLFEGADPAYVLSDATANVLLNGKVTSQNMTLIYYLDNDPGMPIAEFDITAGSATANGQIVNQNPYPGLHVGQSIWKTALIAFNYGVIANVIPGQAISRYCCGAFPFIPVFEHRECVMILVWCLIMPICMFTFWAWQPRGIELLFKRLRENEVVSGLNDDDEFKKFLHEHIETPLCKPWTMFAGIAVVVFVGIGVMTIPNWYGGKGNPMWWSINPCYYRIVTTLSNMMSVYLSYWALLRQIVVIRALHSMFQKEDLNAKMLHSDGCMGFSSIGNYAFTFCAPVLFFAFAWTMQLLFLPVAAGKEPTLFSTCAIIATYPAIVCVFLILPVFTPHRAMVKAREVALEKVAVKIRTWLAMAENNPTASNTDELHALEHQYELVDENCTTWPFRTRMMAKFCLAAVLPLLPTILDVFSRFHSH